MRGGAWRKNLTGPVQAEATAGGLDAGELASLVDECRAPGYLTSV